MYLSSCEKFFYRIAVFPVVRYPETMAAIDKSSTYTPTTAAPSSLSSSESAPPEPVDDHRLKEVPMCRQEKKLSNK